MLRYSRTHFTITFVFISHALHDSKKNIFFSRLFGQIKSNRIGISTNKFVFCVRMMGEKDHFFSAGDLRSRGKINPYPSLNNWLYFLYPNYRLLFSNEYCSSCLFFDCDRQCLSKLQRKIFQSDKQIAYSKSVDKIKINMKISIRISHNCDNIHVRQQSKIIIDSKFFFLSSFPK